MSDSSLSGDGIIFSNLSSNPSNPALGQVYYNTTDEELKVYDGSQWSQLGGGGGGVVTLNANNDAVISTDLVVYGDVITLSDENVKFNIKPIDGALEKVSAINGVFYKLNDRPDREHVGVIAQDVESVVPQAVIERDGIKSVAYGNLVGLLIEAIKELKEEVEILKNESK